MHFLGVGGEALKVIKTKAKRQKMMKNRTKKSFFLYIKKPLNAACYDRCRLICLILMFFVFCWGRLGSGHGGFGGPLPRGLGPSPTPLRSPQLGFQERTPGSALPFLPGLGGGVGEAGAWMQRPRLWLQGGVGGVGVAGSARA